MADTITVTDGDTFASKVVEIEDLNLDLDSAEELWNIWTKRYENGADEDVLVALPAWFAQKELDKNWPYFFAKIEHDDPEKGAILFDSARLVDVNVIGNCIFDQVTMTDALEVLDISDDDDYIDERGKIWAPRSQMYIFERKDEFDPEPGGLADTAADDVIGDD